MKRGNWTDDRLTAVSHSRASDFRKWAVDDEAGDSADGGGTLLFEQVAQ